ncbi:MAG: thiosulfate oxidation carrier protein SoxY [Rhodospirillales bacterium]|nr:thiosulfate oxidation carrier protein SoxY [Rhodospirillales bacterium]MBO6788681.1 thiosulfate oxidation carrier protein SoxY [Rhodospirillales bacterium]
MSTKQALSALTRREALMLAAGATMVAAGGVVLKSGTANADEKMTNDAIMKLIGDKKPADGKITLELPQIAENGNTVPVGVSVDSPMTADNYVKSVHLFADGNPAPDVASLHFTPMSGKASAATRIRLAGTQNIVAVAEMSDGSVYRAQQEVKVTIGGCGG